MKTSDITLAMFSCIGGYIPDVWDSMEFELQRSLSDEEKLIVAETVSKAVERAIHQIEGEQG